MALGALLSVLFTAGPVVAVPVDPDVPLSDEREVTAALDGEVVAAGYQDDYVVLAAPMAQRMRAQYDIPASVALAQAALESNWGRSGLSSTHNNHHGLKCVNATSPGPVAIGCKPYSTQECLPSCGPTTAYFRVFREAEDSFRDYGRLITTASPYARALPYRHDPDRFIREVAAGGYATDPDYANKVVGFMRTYDLYRFDSGAPVGHQGSRVVSGSSADGRVELFAGGADQVYHAYQTSVNGSWSAWEAVGGPGGARLAIAAAVDGRLELFAINDRSAQHLYQTSVNGGWSSWEADFGGGGHDIAVAANASGRLEVIASNGGGLYHRYQQPEVAGYWSSWSSMTDTAGNSGPGDSRIATIRGTNGRIEVFAINDHTAQHLSQTAPDGGWSTWNTTFGGGGYDIAVSTVDTGGRLQVVASNGGGVYHKYQHPDGAGWWTDWASVTDTAGNSGPGNSRLATAHSATGGTEIFAINDHTAQRMTQFAPGQGWSTWDTGFGGGGNAITTATNADRTLQVIATNGGGVYHRRQQPTTPTTWTGWGLLNTPGPGI